MYRLLSHIDESEWRAEWPAARGVFGSVEFARLARQYASVVPHMLVMESAGDRIAYPFFLRSLQSLPFEHPAAGCDTTTPEFTGPFGLSDSCAPAFAEVVKEVFHNLGVVAEFMHLHPWQVAPWLLSGGKVRLNRELVWVDVSLSDEKLWREQFSHACRKNIKRSQAEKIRVFEASTVDDVNEFHRIYFETMDRNQALQSYYFPVEYFRCIFDNLSANARFVLAEHRGDVIAATLYLYDDLHVYSYLGGADYRFQHLRPTNAIIYSVINWARIAGKKRLMLGGGYRSDDGIFKFKASFSNLRIPFYTFERVHSPSVLNRMEEEWSRYFRCSVQDATYFPVYRSVPAVPERISDCDRMSRG